MRISRATKAPNRFSFFLLRSLLAFAVTASVANAGVMTPLACNDLQTLRSLGSDDLSQVTNPRTGDTLSYVVIGDGATGTSINADRLVTDAQVIVLFPGTNGVLPDWPIQMITNSTYSPDIKNTDQFKERQDGRVSLCHDYYLVLFDYPGVGDTSFVGTELTGDQIASDVDAMLDDASDKYGIATDTVSLVGWSLGTLYALKYAFLSPAADTGRSIGDVVLIASKSGGNIDDVSNGNGASCITTLFDALLNEDLDAVLRDKILEASAKLTFPYEDQPPYNKASNDDCTAEIDYDAKEVTVSVDFDCPIDSECRKYVELLAANRAESPWKKTKGVPYSLYVQERDYVADWNFCHCETAGSAYRSEDCSCSDSYASPNSEANGGVCKTWSPWANLPLSWDCVELDMTGDLTVINGPEDLLIQWTYGRQLARAYQRAHGWDIANYVKYRGPKGAGHAAHAQHPRWLQRRIYRVLSD